MQLKLLSLCLLTTSVMSMPNPGFIYGGRNCGFSMSFEQVLTSEAHFQGMMDGKGWTVDRFTPSIDAAGNPNLSRATSNIPVYWHVVYSDTSISGGYVPDSQITASIDAMNSHYRGTGVTFTLAGVTRTQQHTWFTSAGPDTAYQTAMKQQLRQGGPSTINVYSVGFRHGPAAGLLGYSTFPSSYQSNPTDDGVVILYSTVPGGTTSYYNEGKTLTHEVGHWLGLYHVFQGGCTGNGDFVSDTPAQRTATSGCPDFQDSCPGSGIDSVHNYMDYSWDRCLYQFTVGQVTRFRAQIAAYRGIST